MVATILLIQAGDTVDVSEMRWSPPGMYKTLQVMGETIHTSSLVQDFSHQEYDEIWSEIWLFTLRPSYSISLPNNYMTFLKDEYKTDSNG